MAIVLEQMLEILMKDRQDETKNEECEIGPEEIWKIKGALVRSGV